VQFWYTHETAATIARVVADYVGTLGRVACVACPSLFHELSKSYPQVRCDLFEFDTRFQVRIVQGFSSFSDPAKEVWGVCSETTRHDLQGLGNFHFYDYNSPCGIDGTVLRAFDLVIADPPYLVRSCLLIFKDSRPHCIMFFTC
jgi:EEF1A lysine methyltransferase 1